MCIVPYFTPLVTEKCILTKFCHKDPPVSRISAASRGTSYIFSLQVLPRPAFSLLQILLKPLHHLRHSADSVLRLTAS